MLTPSICNNLDYMLDDNLDWNNVSDKDYEKLQLLIENNEKPLYDSCMKFTELSYMLTLFNLKTNNGWNVQSFP